MSKRAAIYCRISSDSTGHALGVERQEEDCRALVGRKRWRTTVVFTDNDVSAYSGKPRKGYAALLEAVKADQVDVIVAWHPDRLHRSPLELESFIDVVEKAGVAVETVQAGPWDLSSPSGRMVARQLGAVARYESEHKSDRVRRALEQRADKGASHGRVSYGWQRVDGQDLLDEDQAAVVRDLAARVLAGHSLRSLAADLNARGIPSPTSSPWTKNKIRDVLLRPRNAGLLVHRGEEIGDGSWPAILDRGTFEQVRAVFADTSRRTTTGSAAKHLLSGLARCGVCESKMYARTNNGTAVYTCHARNCVARARHQVDEYVTAVVLERLSRPDAVDLLKPRDTATRKALTEASKLRARLDAAADEYAEGAIDAAQLRRISERLRPQLEVAEAASRAVDDSPVLAGIVGTRDPRKVWDSMPISARRSLVDVLLTVRVLPLPARKGVDNRVLDPSLIELTWRTS